jgi:hypothetical protein
MKNCGVKQGGILSPLLFCVYFDVLIDRLTQLGQGCHIGLVFLAVMVYADDIVLLAPTASAMRQLLSVCDFFAEDFDVSLMLQRLSVFFLVVYRTTIFVTCLLFMWVRMLLNMLIIGLIWDISYLIK